MDNKKIISEEIELKNQQKTSNVNENNQTKKKSNAQKAMPWLIVAIVSLLIILTCVLIAYYQVYRTGKQNANVLEGVYASSYYSMVDNVNNLQVDLSKYSTLSSNQSKVETMQDMMVDCNYILAGFSVLPINEENVVSATKFFNQVNGVCEAYIRKINKGENLNAEEELLFDKINIVVGKIKSNFNKQNESMYDTSFNFVDASVFNNAGMNELSSGMGNLTDAEVDYPAMIFDGPFSTALETKQILGLPKNEISKEDAKKYLTDIVYKNRDAKIKFEGETAGDIDTFDFNVELDNKDYTVQVSKRGGLLITVSSYAEGGDAIMSAEQASEIAKNFANNVGFDNMEVVWKEVNQNVAYINLASVENSVVMYPDMVKVKVDLTSQEIIGFEALNYAYNHVARNPEFLISEAEAEKVLGFDYNIIKTTKTVIRLDSGTEISAYEFITERIDGVYFYYVNATLLFLFMLAIYCYVTNHLKLSGSQILQLFILSGFCKF